MTSGSPPVGSATSSPTARYYGWLALGFLAFVVYGSLVPLDFRPLAVAEAVDRYRSAWRVPILVESRSDWLSNILLFVPLGFLTSGWLAVDRRRWAFAAVAVSIPVASAALSSAIEFAQVYFPSRTVSPRDVVAETIGGAIGGATWLASGRRPAGLARGREAGDWGLATWLPPAYLLALLVSKVMPLDLTISPGDLCRKYQAGMISLVPFAALASGPAGLARRAADEASSFLVAGLLLGRAGGRRPRGPWAVLAMGLALAACVESAQLFVASRRCDVTDLIVGPLAMLGGRGAGRATLGGGDPKVAGRARAALLSGWLGLVAVSSWLPFDFVADFGAWRDQASRIARVPFADYHHRSVLDAADQAFRKATLFVPLGMVLGGKGGWPLLAASSLAALVEAGQVALPGREPSLADAIVMTAGAWVGHLAARPGPWSAASRELPPPPVAVR